MASAERKAEEAPALANDSLDGARENEAAAGGFYSGTGKKTSEKEKGSKAKGFLKKKGPMGLIIGLIFGVGGLVGGAQMLQPFSLADQLVRAFNSMEISKATRTERLYYKQMNADRNVKPAVKNTIFGNTKFKIGENSRQAKKLKAQGIEIDNDFEGSGIRVMKFDDGTGEIRVVGATEADVAKLDALDLGKFTDSTTGLPFNKKAISFMNLRNTNSDFYYGYNKGSLTWRGTTSGWFGKTTRKFLQSNGLTRNLFKNWQQKIADAEAGNTRTVALSETIAKGTEEISDGGMSDMEAETEDKDDGNGGTKTDYKTDGGDNVSTKVVSETRTKVARSAAGIKTKLDNIAKKYDDGAGAINKWVNGTCTAMTVVGSIGLLVTASEVLQIIHLITAYLEGIDKVKAGDGDESPIHEIANSLNSTQSETYYKLERNGDVSINENSSSAEIAESLKMVPDGKAQTGSAMTSAGVTALYGGGRVNANDPSVKSFNFSSSVSTIFGAVGLSMASFNTCALAKVGAGIADFAVDAINVGSCIAGIVTTVATVGVGGISLGLCGPLIGKAVLSIGASIGLAVLISGIVAAITPWATELFTRDLISDLAGEDLGNALTSGANIYMGNTHQANGGSLATEKEYLAFVAAQQEVIADKAKYERMDKSPFDATSQYTFLGTLVTQLQAFSSSNTIMSTLMSSGSILSSAVTSLMPTSSAIDVTDKVMTVEEGYDDVCPWLASIGAVGDAFCNPYFITDMSTINYDPGDLVADIKEMDENAFLVDDSGELELTDDGNVKINGNSDLAHYIQFCDYRTSAWGFADQNVASEVSKFLTVDTQIEGVDTVTNAAIGAVPAIGSFTGIVQDSKTLANSAYVSGEACVAGNTRNEYSTATPTWNEAKLYQRFVEDQSLLETMGMIEESAVVAYLDEYYEENPLDQSYEGILARYSGLEKEDVVALLDVLEYGNYIASYDASTRYAFVEKDEGDEIDIEFYENQFEQVLSTPVYALVYPELRYRNFTV